VLVVHSSHMVLFPRFCAIFTSAAFAVGDTCAVEDAANDMIPHAGQITDAASANQDGAVFLEIVVDAWYVGRDFLAVG
jgi:hypothetical protein